MDDDGGWEGRVIDRLLLREQQCRELTADIQTLLDNRSRWVPNVAGGWSIDGDGDRIFRNYRVLIKALRKSDTDAETQI